MEDIKIKMTFSDENAAKDFIEYSKKFDSDQELQKKLGEAESEEQLYEAMKEGDYINMSFQEFMDAFKKSIDKFDSIIEENSKFQLNSEELDSITGGVKFKILRKSWWTKDHVKDLVKYVPAVGGTAVSIWDAAEKNEGWKSVGKIASSAMLGAFDAVALGSGIGVGAHLLVYAGTQASERAAHATIGVL